MADDPQNNDGKMVRSVDRAIAAIEILAREGPCGVTEIADELDIHKSTVFRLLATLERRGVVEQETQSQRYRLGFAMVRLASSVSSSLDLVETARSICDHLAVETGETVNLAVLEDHVVVNVHQVNRSPSRVSADWVGSHTELHCTASGKVFLAYLPNDVVDELLEDGFERHTEHTITTRAALDEELRLVRRDGWAATNEELEDGLNAVAAPILGLEGALLASVSVSGPSYRLCDEHRELTIELTRGAGEEISRQLGHLGSEQVTDPA